MHNAPSIDQETIADIVSDPRVLLVNSNGQIDARRSPYNTNWWYSDDGSKVNNKQFLALSWMGTEMLYGGAGGGGKSASLLQQASQFLDVPGYSALLLRRTWGELIMEGGLIPTSIDWFADWYNKDCWNKAERLWSFPSGSSLQFGHVEHVDDVYKYKGTEWQFIGLDESTSFEEFIYRYLFSRLRRKVDLVIPGTNTPLPTRMRCASNPGGKGHEWNRERFLLNGNENRRFIPALIGDNPFLDRADYIASLAHMPEIERLRMQLGNWDVMESGDFFRPDWFEIIDSASVPLAKMKWVRFWDTATLRKDRKKESDWTVGVLMGKSATDKQYYIQDVISFQGTSGTVDARQRQVAELDQQDYGLVQIGEEQMPSSSGKNEIERKRREIFDGFWFTSVPSTHTTGGKIIRVRALSSSAQGKNVKLVRGAWNKRFIDILTAFPLGATDDEADAAAGAFNLLTLRKQERLIHSELHLMT